MLKIVACAQSGPFSYWSHDFHTGAMISEKIKEARAARGLTQQQLADQVHVVRQTVSKWEKGISLPDASNIQDLCSVLGVTSSWILETGENSDGNMEAQKVLEKMKKKEEEQKQASRIRAWMIFLAMLSFIACLSLQGVLSKPVILVLSLLLAAAALVLLWKNQALLTDGQPNVLIKRITLSNIVLLLLLGGVILLESLNAIQISENLQEIMTVILISFLIGVLGLISPRLPFNRHTGLRLPWTVTDEQTWNLAHRIIGWISLPILFFYLSALLIFKNVAVVSIWTILVWIAIPSLLSLAFYIRKYRSIRP